MNLKVTVEESQIFSTRLVALEYLIFLLLKIPETQASQRVMVNGVLVRRWNIISFVV